MNKHKGIRIWTAAAYNLLYQELTKKFGPLSDWATNNRPGRGLDIEYNQFCVHFAKVIGADSGDAVRQQIAFARQETLPGIRSTRSVVSNFVLNKAAAYQAGFIVFANFPGLSSAPPSISSTIAGTTRGVRTVEMKPT
jgi:hypothetical protein